ncbi:hypothetical protein BDV96DRAFT_598205 [Lophiotrema nucula]|uniref:Uncharacterized protein n=1 Tax=Lophiotrema nucula TaxID=690887 RepID=A0A6A5ZCQ7_9PLEO|nr:hypothetical protein BDV96DRAFT_598205 [Lophiotrema nucula]
MAAPSKPVDPDKTHLTAELIQAERQKYKVGDIIRVLIREMCYNPKDAARFGSHFGSLIGKCRPCIVLANTPGHLIVLPIFTSNDRGLDGKPLFKHETCIQGLRVYAQQEFRIRPKAYTDLAWTFMCKFDPKIRLTDNAIVYKDRASLVKNHLHAYSKAFLDASPQAHEDYIVAEFAKIQAKRDKEEHDHERRFQESAYGYGVDATEARAYSRKRCHWLRDITPRYFWISEALLVHSPTIASAKYSVPFSHVHLLISIGRHFRFSSFNPRCYAPKRLNFSRLSRQDRDSGFGSGYSRYASNNNTPSSRDCRRSRSPLGDREPRPAIRERSYGYGHYSRYDNGKTPFGIDRRHSRSPLRGRENPLACRERPHDYEDLRFRRGNGDYRDKHEPNRGHRRGQDYK